jgi:molybdopterin converting factor small subunit
VTRATLTDAAHPKSQAGLLPRGSSTMVTVEIPSALQRFVGQQKRVEVAEGSVKEIFATLVGKHNGLKEQIFDEQGRIRSFVNIYLNDEDIRHAKNLDTVVKPGDVIQIVPSIAGGR